MLKLANNILFAVILLPSLCSIFLCCIDPIHSFFSGAAPAARSLFPGAGLRVLFFQQSLCVTGFRNIEMKAMLTTGSYRPAAEAEAGAVKPYTNAHCEGNALWSEGANAGKKNCHPLNIIQYVDVRNLHSMQHLSHAMRTKKSARARTHTQNNPKEMLTVC